MATYYSAFFSSGLMASQSNADPFYLGSHTPEPPSTPRAAPMNTDDTDIDTTPTAQGYGQTTTAATSTMLPSITETITSPATTNTSGDSRPRLRRRRSSITTSASPLSTLKSSSASAAVQRYSLLTASAATGATRSRSRSGSVNDSFTGRTGSRGNEASQGNSLMGRLRSGSVGTALRPRRVLRRSTAPAPPPPTAPLPLPPSHLDQAPVTPRRPLTTRRSYTLDNLLIPIHTPSLSRTPSITNMNDSDYPMNSSPITAGGITAGLLKAQRGGARTKSDGADMDYPSPVETPRERTSGFFSFDDEMKEN